MTRALFTVLLSASGLAAPAIYPLKDVRPGQQGYGLSVFQGTTPERFGISVIGVVRQFLPKQDLILIRMKHPVTDEAGIIAGMSGSPIYIDDRVVGAVAYGFPFTKGPIAGVTPIEAMLEELQRPLRGPERTPMAMLRSHWFDRLPWPTQPAAPSVGAVRVSLPLSAAGFPETVVGDMERLFAPWNVQPMQGGGTGDALGGPTRFEPGAAIGVQLARGDISLVGTGTVTYVDGKHVLAFGHPFFGAGETYMPIVAANIHMVVPSVQRSFKLSSPLRELGTLVQDRQSTIVGETDRRIPMLPIRLEINSPSDTPRVFQAEIVRHRTLTPMLASLVALSGVRQACSDVADVLVSIRGRLQLRGHDALTLETRAFSRAGVNAGMVASSRPLEALSLLLNNRFEPAVVERVDLEVSADYRSDFAEIEEIRLPSDDVEPGTRMTLEVVVRSYGGGRETVRVPFDIPIALAGKTIKVVAATGATMEPDRAPPENLEDLLGWLKQDYPDDAIVVALHTGEEGVTLRGSVLPELPTSVIDVLKPGASSRRGLSQRASARVLVPHKGMVFGRAEVDIRVRKESRE